MLGPASWTMLSLVWVDQANVCRKGRLFCCAEDSAVILLAA